MDTVAAIIDEDQHAAYDQLAANDQHIAEDPHAAQDVDAVAEDGNAAAEEGVVNDGTDMMIISVLSSVFNTLTIGIDMVNWVLLSLFNRLTLGDLLGFSAAMILGAASDYLSSMLSLDTGTWASLSVNPVVSTAAILFLCTAMHIVVTYLANTKVRMVIWVILSILVRLWTRR